MSIRGGKDPYWMAKRGIVQSGLVLNLDAAVSDSYAGYGTTWYDLSGNNNNGTLTNGPTFNTEKGGSIVFDATDDYISQINFSSIITASFSLAFWVNFTNSASPQYQKIFHAQVSPAEVNIDNYNGGSGNPKLHFYTSATGSSNSILTTGEDIINNTWYYVVGVYDDSLKYKYIYVNSVLKNSATTTVKISWPNSLSRIGRRINDTEPMNGKIATASIYSKALSYSEILQNYNITKKRFGL